MKLKYINSFIGDINKFVPMLLIGIMAIIFGLFSSCATAQENMVNQKKYEDYNSKNFSNPTNIDNEWMPVKPGMQYIYVGKTLDDEGELLDHKVIITITDLIKVIDGVQCRVSWDLDYSDGELVEAELAFFAQDNDGNIWRMGEYPEEYEDGKFIENKCWINGIKGSISGISMRSNPEVGTRSYSQGYAPDVEFTDRGQVDQFEEKICVPVDCYDNVLVIKETSEAEPDANQLKYFANGIGNIKVGWRGEGEKTQEVLDLVEIKNLSSDEMNEVRQKAIELENNAFERNPEVYGLTKPLENSN